MRLFNNLTIEDNEKITITSTPILVGGTGLYINSVLNNIEFSEADVDQRLREELHKRLEAEGANALLNELAVFDKESAERIGTSNHRRLIRAIEIYRTTGKTLTEQNKLSHAVESDIEPLYIGINYADRENLYSRINLRVDLMLEAGLLEEAKDFFKMNPSKTAFNAIGYKELKPFIDGDLAFDVCVENLKRETRRYAKRQITWFKRYENMKWFNLSEEGLEDVISWVERNM